MLAKPAVASALSLIIRHVFSACICVQRGLQDLQRVFLAPRTFLTCHPGKHRRAISRSVASCRYDLRSLLPQPTQETATTLDVPRSMQTALR